MWLKHLWLIKIQKKKPKNINENKQKLLKTKWIKIYKKGKKNTEKQIALYAAVK